MTKKTTNDANYTAIANAIRGKNNTSNTYKPGQMADAIANIQNQYTQSDEGKVVQNGALASQTSLNVTDNGTYDTTTKNSVRVNVPPASVTGIHGYANVSVPKVAKTVTTTAVGYLNS